jgi:hypothetical protein
VHITRRRYPGREVRVMFPIDPEDFFIPVVVGSTQRRGTAPHVAKIPMSTS